MASNTYESGFDEETGSITAEECPECTGRLRTEGGEISCVACGIVIDSTRFDRRGRRSFADDEGDRERTGAPLTAARHDRGLSTEIGFGRDGNGNTLSGKKRRQLHRLRREHTRARWQTKAERNLAHGCTEIARLVAALDLERDVREQASTLFRRAQDNALLPGRSIEAVAAGCVYAVCRCTAVTRTLGEVVAVAQCSRGKVTNAYRVLNSELALPAPPQRPREFIPGQASTLGVPTQTERLARTLAGQAWEAGVSIGVNPSGFGAACLAVACREHHVDVPQLELARAAGVSTATVRTHRDTIDAERGEWSG